MIPQKMENVTAISGPVISGWAATTLTIVCPTKRDITANNNNNNNKKEPGQKKLYLNDRVSSNGRMTIPVGPMLISFDVAKRQ
jgi:hypothetical protein